MKKVAGIIAVAGLSLSLVPAFLVFAGSLRMALYKELMLTGAALWFAGASLWFRREPET